MVSCVFACHRVRERQRLLEAPRTLIGRRVVVGETGGLAALVESVRTKTRRLWRPRCPASTLAIADVFRRGGRWASCHPAPAQKPPRRGGVDVVIRLGLRAPEVAVASWSKSNRKGFHKLRVPRGDVAECGQDTTMHRRSFSQLAAATDTLGRNQPPR